MPYTVRDAHTEEVDNITHIIEEVLSGTIYSTLSFDHDMCANMVMCGILKQQGWFLRVIADEKNDKAVGGLLGWCGEFICSKDKIAHDVAMMIQQQHRGRCIRQFLQVVEEYKTWALNEGAKVVKIGVSSGLKIDAFVELFERVGWTRTGAILTV